MEDNNYNSNNYGETREDYYAPQTQSSNIITGFIGAFIGSLLGVAVWVLIDYMGYIAGISGVLMLTAGFKGYELLGGTLDKKGMILCVIISFIMIFVAVNVSMIVSAIREVGMASVKRYGIMRFLNHAWNDPEIRSYIFKDLVIGLVLYIVSGYNYIKRVFSA